MNGVALRMLLGDRAKFLGIVAGVALAALLISHQVTIFVGLMSRTRSIFQTLDHADLIVADPATEFVEDAQGLSDTQARRVGAVAGVEWAVPMLRASVKARFGGGGGGGGGAAGGVGGVGKMRTCVVVGLDDATLIGGPSKMVEGRLADLRRADGVIIDRLDAEKLLSVRGPDGSVRTPRVGDVLELNDRRAVVVGISDNPRPFLSQPILYTTLSRARQFAPRERRQVSFALARLSPGADPEAVRARVREETGLEAYTRTGFGWKTIGYFLRNTGIPVNFGVTVLLGAIVGVGISGQTFYLFTLDNARHLAALKAMGAGNGRLARMVLLQAGVVGCLGYGIGIGLTALFFVSFIGTDLDFQVHWQVLALTAAAVLGIAAVAAGASLSRVLRLEPGMVFRA